MALNNRQRVFVEEYLKCWNATESAKRAGYSPKTAYSIGQENLKKPEIESAIKARVSEIAMSANEVLLGLAEQARADLGVFFKVVEEWTFYPLPTYDVLDAEEVEDTTDPDNPRTRVNYLVRHIAIDIDKLADPRYSHLLRKFSDSRKDGIGIEIYNRQAALVKLAQIHGLLKEKTEVTGKDGGDIVIRVVFEDLPSDGSSDERDRD